MNFPVSHIDQIALIVEDLQLALSRYHASMGYGPWQCYQYDSESVPYLRYRGKATRAQWKIAMADVNGLNFELIEPVSTGDNIYTEFVERHGYGLHHVGINVPNTEAICRIAQQSGIDTLMEGRGFGVEGDGHFAYLDTVDLLGMIVELREIPKKRVAPHWTFP